MYWLIAIAIGVAVSVAVPWIAQRWVTTVDFSPLATSRPRCTLCAVLLTAQWPFSFYGSGLAGLNRQVAMAAVTAGVATLRAIGAIAILVWIAPTIHAFLAWQVVVSAVSTSALAYLLWTSLPASAGATRFEWRQIRERLTLTSGLAFVGVAGMVLTQSDRIVLSRLLPLDAFGYYTLAASVGVALFRLTAPLFTAVFPHMTRAAAVAISAGPAGSIIGAPGSPPCSCCR